jgi:hypothetical protein
MEFTAERFFDRHAIAKAARKSFRWQSEFSRPIFYALRFAIKCQQFCRPSISSLNRFGCPATILRTVISIVVDAIQRMSRWPFSHVREKISKGVPTLAYGDSSGSVVLPRICRWICASGKHCIPDTINWRPAQTVRLALSVSRDTPAITMGSKTLSSIEIVSINLAESPASALTLPASRTYPSDDGPKTISLTGDILESSHVAPCTCGLVRGPVDVSASLGLAIVANDAA